MFAHVTTMKELNDAYDATCRATQSTVDFGAVIAALQNGTEPPYDDRYDRLDAITTAMQARWSELTGEPWPN